MAALNGNGLACARMSFLRKYGRPGISIDKVEAETWVRRVQDQGPHAIDWLIMAADEYNHPAGKTW